MKRALVAIRKKYVNAIKSRNKSTEFVIIHWSDLHTSKSDQCLKYEILNDNKSIQASSMILKYS